MTSQSTSKAATIVEEFMAAFIEAWPTGDGTGLGRFFSEGAVFRNGPTPPVKGRDAIVANCSQQMTLGGEVSVDMLHMLADGPIVMTERIDYVKLDGRIIPLRIMGIFEVHDGAITAWRDYFDPTEFSSRYLALDPKGSTDVLAVDQDMSQRPNGWPACGGVAVLAGVAKGVQNDPGILLTA